MASFNIQILGESKIAKADVVSVLLKVLSRYDFIAVQEIRDDTELAFPQLVKQLNSKSSVKYEHRVGPRQGNSNSKEQYGFIYNPAKLEFVELHVYADPNKVFERPPVSALFKLKGSLPPRQIVVSNIHTQPTDAVREIDALYDVHVAVTNKWKVEDVLIVGDYNAGCSYVSASKLETLRPRVDKRFKWLVPIGLDTTTKDSHCTYDHAVVTGKFLHAAVVGGAAAIFDFRNQFKLTDEQTHRVSDHFPIEWTLSYTGNPLLKTVVNPNVPATPTKSSTPVQPANPSPKKPPTGMPTKAPSAPVNPDVVEAEVVEEEEVWGEHVPADLSD